MTMKFKCADCGSNEHPTGSVACNRFDQQAKEIPVTPEELAQSGTRNDRRKPRVDLIPPEVLIELAKLCEYGARKYSENNWRRGMNYSRMYGSMQRHALKFWSGEAIDEEGFHHLIAVIWNAVGLMYFELYPDTYEGFDDRWPSHEMDFPDAQVDLPRDPDTGRFIKIPYGYKLRGPDEIIKENDLFWDEGDWVNVPKTRSFCGPAVNSGKFIIYAQGITSPIANGSGVTWR